MESREIRLGAAHDGRGFLLRLPIDVNEPAGRGMGSWQATEPVFHELGRLDVRANRPVRVDADHLPILLDVLPSF